MQTAVTKRGQTVIPAAIRRRYQIKDGDSLIWIDDGETIRVIPVARDPISALRGSGRGAMANPWIFLQVEQLRRGEQPFEPSPADKHDLLLRYLDMCLAEMPERLALNKLKQLIGQFSVGLPGSAALREAVHRSTAPDEARDHIERFFAPHLEEMLV